MSVNTLQIEEIDISGIDESINTNTTDLKENIILDLSKQLKEKYDKVADLEIKLIKQKKKETKQILKIYGLIKSIEKVTNETVEVPRELQGLIDVSADMMEDFIEEEFFPVFEIFRLHD